MVSRSAERTQDGRARREARPAWHAMEPEEALRELESVQGGLAPNEVQRRQSIYGPNAIAHAQGEHPLRILAQPFSGALM